MAESWCSGPGSIYSVDFRAIRIMTPDGILAIRPASYPPSSPSFPQEACLRAILTRKEGVAGRMARVPSGYGRVRDPGVLYPGVP